MSSVFHGIVQSVFLLRLWNSFVSSLFSRRFPLLGFHDSRSLLAASPLITFIFRLSSASFPVATRRRWVSPEDQPPGCLPRTPVVRIQAHAHTKPPFHQAEPSLTSDRESPPGGPAGVCALEFGSVVVVYTKRITACTPLSPRLGSALLGRTFCCSLRLCPFFHVSE